MNINWQFDVSIYRAVSYDQYGDSTHKFIGKSQGGAIKFDIGKTRANSKTTSRSTGAMSSGKADLDDFDAYIVMPVNAPVRVDDILLIRGVKLEVVRIRRHWGIRKREGTIEVGLVAFDLSNSRN